MPTDTKRLPVPEDSRPPVYKTHSPLPLIRENGLRADDRTVATVRPIFARVGAISRARGSSYVELGRTKVICAVYGPREVSRREEFSMNGQLLCYMKYARFSSLTQHRQHQQDMQERELSQVLREALEPAVILDKFAKSRMDIFVTVLEDDGGCLACAITAASLALTHARVDMFDLVIGASLRCCEQLIVVDPSSDEEQLCISETSRSVTNDSTLTIGYMPSLRQVSALLLDGVIDQATNQKCIAACIETCVKLYPVLQLCIKESLKSDEKDSTSSTNY